MQNLAGKTAFVTGGASGIGLGITKALLKAGMNVVMADIREDSLEQAQAEVGNPERVLALQLDVTNRKAYAEAADAAERRFGKIHLLINNAGVAMSGPVHQATYSDWDWVLGVNLGGAINGIVEILPRILAHGEGGHIVNTSSTSGLLPHPGAPIYTTSKAAVIGMSEALRCELEPKGVIVSVFCPGPVRSNIGESSKTRPAALADTGYTQSRPGQWSESMLHLIKTADAAGELVREGIEQDALYILTHNEHKSGLEERAAAIGAAMPDVPENEEFKKLFAVALRNPAYAAETERRSKKK